MRSFAARTAKDRDFLGGVERFCGSIQLVSVWSQRIRLVVHRQGQCVLRTIGGHDCSRDDDDGDSALHNRSSDRGGENAREQIGLRHQRAIVAALFVENFWMRFLKIIISQLDARNLRRDRHHRNAAAIAIEEAVDQVQVSGAAAPGAHGQLVGEVRFAARSKLCSLDNWRVSESLIIRMSTCLSVSRNSSLVRSIQ